MLDNFREWLSDNLRYILLGLGIILVVLILIFGGRAIAKSVSKNKGNDKKTEQEDKKKPADEKDAEEKDSEKDGDKEPTSEPGKEAVDDFSKNANKDVNEVVTAYYKACSAKDIEGVRKVYDGLTESEIGKIKNNSNLEAYSDIGTYVKAGPTKGTYIVFVEYKIKYKDITTLAPGLTRMYLFTDKDGNLKIVSEIDDQTVEDAIETAMQETEVQALIQRVNKEYLNAQNADPALKKFLEDHGVSVTAAAQADIGATITVAKNCNVRKGPGTTYDGIGGLRTGDQVVKKGSDGDWIMIELNGQTGYVRSDMFQ